MSFTIPSTDEDRKRIHNALKEMNNHLTIIDSARDAIKDIRDMLKDEFDMPHAVANKLSNTMYKQDFHDKEAAFEDFAAQYDILVKSQQR